MSDDFVQQLADAAESVRLRHVAHKQHGHVWGCQCGWTTADRHAPIDLFKRHAAEQLARAVLASRLVVPTSDVLNLAQQWENAQAIVAEYDPRLHGYSEGRADSAAELRALTQIEQEN